MATIRDNRFLSPLAQPVDYPGSDRGILLMHGFTGTPAHMRKLADGLREKGYTVKSILLPGHGTSEEDMAEADWQKWLQAAKEAARELLDRCKTVTVCGLSMGGVLALILAEQMPVHACVPISAPTATQNPFLCFAGVAWPFLPRIPWQNNPEKDALMDGEYNIGYAGFPTKKGADLYHLIKLAKKNLFAIRCPLSVVQSDGDKTIWLGSAEYILNNVSSKEKYLLPLTGHPHVCTTGEAAPAIVEEIARITELAAKQ
jgi:carboxylesterase